MTEDSILLLIMDIVNKKIYFFLYKPIRSIYQ